MFPAFSPRARCPAACTDPTGWAGTPCLTWWCSAAARGWARWRTWTRWAQAGRGPATRTLRRHRPRRSRRCSGPLVSAAGGTAYNPGWHLALDLRNIMLIAECVALAALERQESRGGHTRDDFPGMSPQWRKVNLICALDGDRIT